MPPVKSFRVIRMCLYVFFAVMLLPTAAQATWNLLQTVSWPNGGAGCPINTTQCTLSTFQNPTTAGSTLVLGFGIQAVAEPSSQVEIVSAYTCVTLTAGVCDPMYLNVIDTFTIPTDPSGNHLCADYTDPHSVDCAYVLAGLGNANYVTVNITSGSNHWFASMTEVPSSSGTQTLDAVGAAKNGTFSTTHSGVALSTTGTDDFVFQIIDASSCLVPSDSCTITASPSCSGQTWSGLFDDHYASAYALSTPCGTAPTAPTWTCSGSNCSGNGVVGAVAFTD